VTGTIDSPRAIGAVAGALLEGVDLSPGIRLLGVSVSGLGPTRTEAHQLTFADAAPDDGSATAPPARPVEVRLQGWEDVEAAVTAIRTRYGHASVGPATLIGGSGLSVKRRGDMQWGPSASADEAPGAPGKIVGPGKDS
jgi:DNA polymerase-4